MWRVENRVTGKIDKWYEAELIDVLKSNCQLMIDFCNKCEGNPNIDCIDCTQGGKAIMSHHVLDLIESYEVER